MMHSALVGVKNIHIISDYQIVSSHIVSLYSPITDKTNPYFKVRK